jgi:hypothetical protein
VSVLPLKVAIRAGNSRAALQIALNFSEAAENDNNFMKPGHAFAA